MGATGGQSVDLAEVGAAIARQRNMDYGRDANDNGNGTTVDGTPLATTGATDGDPLVQTPVGMTSSDVVTESGKLTASIDISVEQSRGKNFGKQPSDSSPVSTLIGGSGTYLTAPSAPTPAIVEVAGAPLVVSCDRSTYRGLVLCLRAERGY